MRPGRPVAATRRGSTIRTIHTPFTGADIHGVLAFARKLVDSQDRAHALVRALRDDLVLLDVAGRIVDVNLRFLEMTGLTRWLWNRDDDALACRAFLHAADVDPGDFEQEKRRLKFRPGEGKPGEAWTTGRPVVTDDTEYDPSSARGTSRSGAACARPWRLRSSNPRGRSPSSPTVSSAARRGRASFGRSPASDASSAASCTAAAPRSNPCRYPHASSRAAARSGREHRAGDRRATRGGAPDGQDSPTPRLREARRQ